MCTRDGGIGCVDVHVSLCLWRVMYSASQTIRGASEVDGPTYT